MISIHNQQCDMGLCPATGNAAASGCDNCRYPSPGAKGGLAAAAGLVTRSLSKLGAFPHTHGGASPPAGAEGAGPARLPRLAHVRRRIKKRHLEEIKPNSGRYSYWHARVIGI